MSVSKTLFIRVGFILLLTALPGLFVSARLAQQGKWVPNIPNTAAGVWTATDVPLSEATLNMMGRPPALGRQYQNSFDESVEANIIATRTFDAYTEPLVAQSGYGYSITAETRLPIFGTGVGPVRAVVLKGDNAGDRVLMFFWVQDEKGNVTGEGGLRSNKDVVPRLITGLNVTRSGRQSCIVRAFSRVSPADQYGAQARRNIIEVCRSLYEDLKKDGAAWSEGKRGAGKGGS